MARDPHDQRGRPGFRVPDGDAGKVFPNFAVTVDCVLVVMDNGLPHVVLTKRQLDPFAGEWGLPGGFKRVDETLDEAITRQLYEKAGIRLKVAPRQLGAFGNPNRDPRPNVVTVVFLALTRSAPKWFPGRNVTAVDMFPLDDVANGELETAFDHRVLVEQARQAIADRLEREPLVIDLLPPEFTLSDFCSVYESFWRVRLDPSNVRRALLRPSLPYLETTGERVSSSDRGRPPELFRPTSNWRQGPPPIRLPRGQSSLSSWD